MAEDHVQRGICVQGGQLVLELLGQEAVVGVEKREVVTACLRDRGVARGSGAAALLPRDQDPVAVRFRDGARVVFRAVVDDDDLERPMRLGEGALDRLGEVGPGVVRGDQDADQFRGGRGRVSSARARSRSSFAFSSSIGIGASRWPATRLPTW